MEVVVNVHAGLTTTSKPKPASVFTKPKRKSITSKQKAASTHIINIQEAAVTKHYQSRQQLQNSHNLHPANMEEVVQHSSACTTTQEHKQPQHAGR